MAIQYQGLSGKKYLVEEKLAGGGEGAIHRILDNDTQVAKIFKPDRRSAEREEKLRSMVQTGLSKEQLEEVTWPQDVIYDQTGFAGYIMPKLKNTSSLTSIYSGGTNNEYDLRYRLLAAINLCHAIKTVHDMGQVCGDLNPQNICINLDVTNPRTAFHITLVDTDSYHFTSEGKTYRCEVGLGDYIAPELQKKISGGQTLKNAPLPTYTKETDLFALAVHIFNLLMNGCHPFACAKAVKGTYENTMPQMEPSRIRDSVVAPQPIENIKDGYFPFYHQKEGVTYPIYAPSFASLPEEIQRLFIRTFVEGYENPSQRADTREWIDALMRAREKMGLCAVNPKHYYFGHNASCPLCGVENRITKLLTPPETWELEEEEKSEESGGVEKKKEKSSRKKILLYVLSMMILFIGYGIIKSYLSEYLSGYTLLGVRLIVLFIFFILIMVLGSLWDNLFSSETSEEVEEEGTPLDGNPWELALDKIECPKFGGTLQIPQGATIEDDGDGIEIELHESIGKTIEISSEAAYYVRDFQSSYDVKPSEKFTNYYKEYCDGDPYILDVCEYKKIGSKWFTIVQYHREAYTILRYLTSNQNICYRIEMGADNNDVHKMEYVALLEKIAATIQFKQTYITGNVYFADGSSIYKKASDEYDIYFKNKEEPTEDNYDEKTTLWEDGFETVLAPGTYYVLVTHKKRHKVDYSYKSEITIPKTNNGKKEINIVVSEEG